MDRQQNPAPGEKPSHGPVAIHGGSSWVGQFVTQDAPASPPTWHKPRFNFMGDLPEYNYVMPAGPQVLNFTVVEVVALLPVWFKNWHFAQRFQNNGMPSNVHLAMFEEHRDVVLSEEDSDKAKDRIADAYRKAMRRKNPAWKKITNRVPADWNDFNMSVSNFVPDEYESSPFLRPRASIPFKKLSYRVKKLPQGADAGDLTNALSYALQHKKPSETGPGTEYMFPDDIHTILQHTGYTSITAEHTDRFAILRYARLIEHLRFQRRLAPRNITPTPDADSIEPPTKRQQLEPLYLHPPAPVLTPLTLPVVANPEALPLEQEMQQLLEEQASFAQDQSAAQICEHVWPSDVNAPVVHFDDTEHYGFPDLPDICTLSSDLEEHVGAAVSSDSSVSSAEDNRLLTDEEMEAIMAPFQTEAFDFDA